MGFLSSIFSGSISSVIDSVGKAADSLVTSDEERLQLRNKLVEIKTKANLDAVELANKYEHEITERNNSDQVHGNFLTKSARPIFLYWVMGIITVLVFGGLGGKTVDPAYITMVQSLAITAVTFFFGSKGLEIYKHGKQI